MPPVFNKAQFPITVIEIIQSFRHVNSDGVINMMYVLSFQRSGTPHEPFVARTSVVTIGRSELCDVQLLENGVSEQHASIEQRSDGFYIQSAAASGTLQVNSKPVTDTRLASGDEIELGSVCIHFEITHELGEKKQQRSLLTYVMMAIIVVSILGQIGVIAWIYATPRPRKEIPSSTKPKLKDIVPSKEGIKQGTTSAPSISATPSASTDGTITREQITQRKQPERTIPQILNRMIRILGVRRADQTTEVTLTIRLKSQVGQKQLNTSDVAVSVQAFRKNIKADGVMPIETRWLDIVDWQNFSARSFTTRLQIPPNEFGGYVIRTYYRNQLQDVRASSQELLKTVPKQLQNLSQ